MYGDGALNCASYSCVCFFASTKCFSIWWKPTPALRCLNANRTCVEHSAHAAYTTPSRTNTLAFSGLKESLFVLHFALCLSTMAPNATTAASNSNSPLLVGVHGCVGGSIGVSMSIGVSSPSPVGAPGCVGGSIGNPLGEGAIGVGSASVASFNIRWNAFTRCLLYCRPVRTSSPSLDEKRSRTSLPYRPFSSHVRSSKLCSCSHAITCLELQLRISDLV